MINKELIYDSHKVYSNQYFNSERDISPSRIKKTVHLLGDVKNKLILDLGCGTGEGSILLRKLGAKVICADFAYYSLLICQRMNLDTVLSSAHLLPFNKACFDAVLFMDVIEHIPSVMVAQTLYEIKRVTKTNGRIAIHTMPTLFLEKLSSLYGLINKRHWRRWGIQGGHINTYTPWRLERDIESAGLKILQFEIGTYPSKAPFSKLISPFSTLFKSLLGNDLWVCCSPNLEGV